MVLQIQYRSKQAFLFFDKKLRSEKQGDYLKRLEAYYEGHNIIIIMKTHHRFGTLSLITNIDDRDRCKIPGIYKSRYMIEQMKDVFKNILEGYRFYVRDKERLEGCMLISY